MLKKNKLLFIDDEESYHTLMELIISTHTDLELISALSSSQAIDLANRHADSISVIISDVLLPDINGKVLIKKIRKNKSLSNSPVIFQTGLTEQDIDVKELKLPNSRIIHKPYTHIELLDAIEKLSV